MIRITPCFQAFDDAQLDPWLSWPTSAEPVRPQRACRRYWSTNARRRGADHGAVRFQRPAPATVPQHLGPDSRLIEVACGFIVVLVYRRSASRDNSRGTGGLLEQTFEFVTVDAVALHDEADKGIVYQLRERAHGDVPDTSPRSRGPILSTGVHRTTGHRRTIMPP